MPAVNPVHGPGRRRLSSPRSGCWGLVPEWYGWWSMCCVPGTLLYVLFIYHFISPECSEVSAIRTPYLQLKILRSQTQSLCNPQWHLTWNRERGLEARVPHICSAPKKCQIKEGKSQLFTNHFLKLLTAVFLKSRIWYFTLCPLYDWYWPYYFCTKK